jgi:hypothetical protein
MGFKVLRAHGKEKQEWLSLIDNLMSGMKDIHFLPQYGSIYEKTYGFEPFLACYSDDRGYVIQHFVKRSLSNLAFLQNTAANTADVVGGIGSATAASRSTASAAGAAGTTGNAAGVTGSKEYYDISNPYGYGGPVFNCEDAESVKALIRDFETSLRDFFINERFASEFTSLHPLLQNHLLIRESEVVDIVEQKNIVYIDLTLSEQEIWQGMNRGHKSSINKAKRNGVTVTKVDQNAENFAIFNELYYETMRRNQAADRWFFPEDYFANCSTCLGPDRTSMFFARIDGELAAAYFLMHDFSTVYYHFGASDSRFFDLRPSNLLMYETALWAKGKGYKIYHLGGGVSSSPDDNLYRFKAGFSSGSALLYTYSRVLHGPTYEELCKLKIQHELQENGIENESEYFPLYRR